MSTASHPLAARRAALTYVSAVLHNQADPGLLVDPLNRLDPAERAEAQRLAQTILRHRSNLDTLIQRFAPKPPPPSIRRILYLTLVETQLYGSKDYASVHSAVELAKSDPATKGKFKSLVNAVARKLAELPPDTLGAMKPPKLPKPLRGPMIGAFTQPVVERIEAAHVAAAPIDICLNNGVEADLYDGAAQFADGHARLPADVQVSGLPGYDDGAFWVQDFAAQAPVRALGDIDGLSVLDLCAAPGGKTMQLAAAGAKVTAVDISEARLGRLDENLYRTRLSADIIVADALHWEPDERFDIVLLDAPCSATGTIRRHPDLPYLKTTAEINALIDLQRQIAARAVDWVKPDGRYLIITCSLLPKEGELFADWIEGQAPHLTPEPLRPISAAVPYSSPNRCRLRPDMLGEHGGMDGFFFALYRRDK